MKLVVLRAYRDVKVTFVGLLGYFDRGVYFEQVILAEFRDVQSIFSVH